MSLDLTSLLQTQTCTVEVEGNRVISIVEIQSVGRTHSTKFRLAYCGRGLQGFLEQNSLDRLMRALISFLPSPISAS